MVGIVCLKGWKFDSYNVGILTHETLHLLIDISYVCGCEMNIHTTECWAYAMNSFIETFIDVLNTKYLRDKNKRRK